MPADEIASLQVAFAGRYSLERLLGHGGGSRVVLATDPKIDKRVAIKVLRSDLSELLGDRFLAEIAVVARLSHPNIIPILDSGAAGGFVYYVMPYLEGDSLRQRLQSQHQLPIPEALQIGRDVAAALAYAHHHGVVHSDVKPENVLLKGNRAVLVDFGLAATLAAAAAGERLTRSGLAVGTPQYMSPEQIQGERVDERSDIYSLGCVLYETLAGEAPFTGSSVQGVIARHLSEEVPSLSTARPAVPAPVWRGIERALAKVPAERYQTAHEFLVALAALLEAVGGGAPPEPAKLTAERADDDRSPCDLLRPLVARRYGLRGPIGRGGMATVCLAEDLKHGRQVAIKLLEREDLWAERFLLEVKTTAQLNHPHIVELFDSGEAGRFLYYVMPFVEGGSLRNRLAREGRIGVPEAVGIASTIAEALHYAHQRGVVHRDVKPENILFRHGYACLSDFGIAKAIEAAGGLRLTEPGRGIGTPPYISPEQMAGEDIDGRSDVYSLALVVYEMLSGQLPSMRMSSLDVKEVLRRAAGDSVNALVPAITKALSIKRDERHGTAAEFKGELLGAVTAR